MSFTIKKDLTVKVKKDPTSRPKVNKVNEAGLVLHRDKPADVIRLARCYKSPNGDFGLHGFMQGSYYHTQYFAGDKNGVPYYRVWTDYHNSVKNYKTIKMFDFQYYFKVEGLHFFKGTPPARSQRK